MTVYYQCDNCRKTSSEHELVWIDKEKGSPLCRHCWGFVSYAFEAVDLGPKVEEVRQDDEVTRFWAWLFATVLFFAVIGVLIGKAVCSQ
ncbi:hypothetical protein PHAGE_JEFFCO_53 [Acinetobacter phage JeffCo]|nr:hypothetical protein PHAGE_JEFFCO_53 [Acinetobacter phage JeffCo]